jgi:hypothetical protein
MKISGGDDGRLEYGEVLSGAKGPRNALPP